MTNDKEFVLQVIKLNKLSYVPRIISDKEELMLEAVKINGFALHYVSKELQKIQNL